MGNSLIILDRDGILNKLLIRSDGSPDSPMNIDEIDIFPWVPEQLKILNNLNYGLVIATNQPAYAKGKISKKNLLEVECYIENSVQSNGAILLGSFICFHRAEDFCDCRKPKIGLLDSAFKTFDKFQTKYSWMVGDRATDVIAGHNYGLKTALLGPSVKEDINILQRLNIKPDYCGNDLRDFVKNI